MKERDYHLDLIRLISIFLVVMIHTSNYYCKYLGTVTSASYIGACFYNCIARISVPLFFMISGALTLGRDMPAEKLKKKIFHFIFVLIFWTVFYIIFDLTYMGYHFKVKEYINLIFTELKPHLWFMYAIIGLYIISPFARILVKGMSKAQQKYFIILWMVFTGGVKMLRLFLTLFHIKTRVSYAIPLVESTYYFGYYVIGYLLYAAVKEGLVVKKKVILPVYLVCAASAFGCTVWSSIHNGKFYDEFLTYRNLFVILETFAIFLLIIESKPIEKEKVKKFLGTVSPLLFGVYLVHIVFMDFLVRSINIKVFNAIYGVPVFSLGIFLVTLLCVWLINKIPYVRRVIQ